MMAVILFDSWENPSNGVIFFVPWEIRVGRLIHSADGKASLKKLSALLNVMAAANSET